MMGKESHIHMRIDSDLKKEAREVIESLEVVPGQKLTISKAVKIFLRQTIKQGKIPFDFDPEDTYKE